MKNAPDPPVKWQIRERLLRELYQQVEAERWEQMKLLVTENTALQQYSHLSFAYNGLFYNLTSFEGPVIRNKVHPDLEARVKQFVDYYDRLVLGEEKTRISGFLDSVLSFSERPADWLAVLPHTMQNTLRKAVTTDDWTTCNRTPEQHVAFIEKHKPRYELVKQRLAMNLIT